MVIVELNVASWHSTDKDLFIALKGENLVKFRPVNKFQLDPIIGRSAPLIDFTVSTAAPILTLEKVYSQMRRAERNDETIFERERHV